MKNYRLIITTLIFFLLVNTTYFWEGKLGLIAFPVFWILVVVYIGLVIGFTRNIYFAIREKFNNKPRLVILTILIVVITLAFFRPHGFIDFDKLQGADILIASREGGGGCNTTLKLKENNRFIKRSVCFGVNEIKGTYKIKGDTIFFENISFGILESEFYKFAVIKSRKYKSEKYIGDLAVYKDYSDTTEKALWIIKNDLSK